MRQCIPGLGEKTDKATVFEFAAAYLLFLRRQIGSQFDKVSLCKKVKTDQRSVSSKDSELPYLRHFIPTTAPNQVL